MCILLGEHEQVRAPDAAPVEELHPSGRGIALIVNGDDSRSDFRRPSHLINELAKGIGIEIDRLAVKRPHDICVIKPDRPHP